MPIHLTELIRQVSPEVATRVKRAVDRSRPVLQEALRAECRLVMRTPEEAEKSRPGAQVPVHLDPGYPQILAAVSFPDELERVLLISRFRAAIRHAHEGLGGLLELRRELERLPTPEAWIHVTEAELQSAASWSDMLLTLLDRHDPVSAVLAVREDVLGVYECDARGLAEDREVNPAAIRVYWGVVGLAAEWMGWDVEDLAVVVLAHELAHAYTQLGADIEGRRWPARAFRHAETGLKEGLAQYYTDRVLRRLSGRYAGALRVYEDLLRRQPGEYHTHEPWVLDSTPEAVRRAMIEVRRWNEGALDDFNRRLTQAHRELHPGHREG